MAIFHRVLVPTDFSRHSVEAVRVAGELARLCGARLTVMTVYETLVVAPISETSLAPRPQVMVGAYEHTCRQLADAVAEARKHVAAGVDSVIATGAPFTEIMRQVREGGHDLIVMGTHGRTGVLHFFLGSVAERVVRRAPCAVLTVRLPHQHVDEEDDAADVDETRPAVAPAPAT